MSDQTTASSSEIVPGPAAGGTLRKPHITQVPTFSGEVIRFLVGVIALALPVAVLVVAYPLFPGSISGSYYTAAHNLFVGCLFALGTVLFVYKGRTSRQFWFAKAGALAPLLAALCPTTCESPLPAAVCAAANNPPQTNGTLVAIHLGAGAALFLVGWFFCWGPFRQAAQQNAQGGKREAATAARRRIIVYRIGGSVIISFLLLTGFAQVTQAMAGWQWPAHFTYFTEWVMLWAFGFAWLVAAKLVYGFSTAAERRRLLKDLVWDPFKTDVTTD